MKTLKVLLIILAFIFGTEPIGMFILSEEQGGFFCFCIGYLIAFVSALIGFIPTNKLLEGKEMKKVESAYSVAKVVAIISATIYAVAFIINMCGSTTSYHLQKIPWSSNRFGEVSNGAHWHSLPLIGIAGIFLWICMGVWFSCYLEKGAESQDKK